MWKEFWERFKVWLARFVPEADAPHDGPKTDPVADYDAALMTLLGLHNAARVGHARELVLYEPLNLAAQFHANTMARLDQLSHQAGGTTLGQRLQRHGYAFSAAGENIAWGQETPAGAVRAWLRSPPHQANVLHPAYWHMGAGVARGAASGRLYWCVVFATPARREGGAPALRLPEGLGR